MRLLQLHAACWKECRNTFHSNAAPVSLFCMSLAHVTFTSHFCMSLPCMSSLSVTPADPGQTYNTSETLSRLIRSHPQLVLLLGDFAYADNWLDENTPIPDGQWGTVTCEHGAQGCDMIVQPDWVVGSRHTAVTNVGLTADSCGRQQHTAEIAQESYCPRAWLCLGSTAVLSSVTSHRLSPS